MLELRTACPADLCCTIWFSRLLASRIDWFTSADREHLQAWAKSHAFRSRLSYDRFDDPHLSDRLVYWWDLQDYRGREVTLSLTFGGSGSPGEIAWRGLSLRSAVANLPAGESPVPDVPLTSLEPLRKTGPRGLVVPLRDSLPGEYRPPPIRFLGQRFSGGYGMREGSAIEFPLRPEYRQFVALVGCCGSRGRTAHRADRWRGGLGASPGARNRPGRADRDRHSRRRKTLTLATEGSSSRPGHAAWAEAGFVTK